MTLSTHRARWVGTACMIALAALLMGCNGTSSTASTSGGGNSGTTVQGVATPSSVSVVTAN